MAVTDVRDRTKPDRPDDTQALIDHVFAALDTLQPEGLRYMSLRLDDGVSFVHVAAIDTPDSTNPLAGVPAFAEFQRDIAERCEEQPLVTDASLIGSYRSWLQGATE